MDLKPHDALGGFLGSFLTYPKRIQMELSSEYAVGNIFHGYLCSTLTPHNPGVFYIFCSRDVKLWPLQWRNSSRLVWAPDIWYIYK